jgi:choline-glycine betaine transporter
MFMSIQLINLSLKLDDIVDWKWRETFWAYWIFFSIMIGLSFAIT